MPPPPQPLEFESLSVETGTGRERRRGGGGGGGGGASDGEWEGPLDGSVWEHSAELEPWLVKPARRQPREKTSKVSQKNDHNL